MKKNFFYLALVGILLGCQPQQSSNNEIDEKNQAQTPTIEGAWEIVAVSVTNDDTSFVFTPYRSIIILTEKYYSIEIATQDRPSWPEIADGELVPYDLLNNAYSYLISNSGTYKIRGDSIDYNAIIAKFPNFMNDFSNWSAAFSLDGDELITSESGRNFWNSTVKTTYKRIE